MLGNIKKIYCINTNAKYNFDKYWKGNLKGTPVGGVACIQIYVTCPLSIKKQFLSFDLGFYKQALRNIFTKKCSVKNFYFTSYFRQILCRNFLAAFIEQRFIKNSFLCFLAIEVLAIKASTYSVLALLLGFILILHKLSALQIMQGSTKRHKK